MYFFLRDWFTVICYYWAVPKILWKASSWSKMLQQEFWWDLTGDHISPVLASLHWLPVKFRVEFKILDLTYKALNDRAHILSYLKDFIVRYLPNRVLLSQTAGLLVAPRVPKSRLRTRAFSYQAPLLWNQLSVYVREADTLSNFKIRLETFLFDKAYS